MGLCRRVKRSVILTCLYYLADDWCARSRLVRGKLATRSGTRHATLSLDESLDYIEWVYRDYLAYGGIEGFSGCVAEVGPGDNFGVALRMLGAGAEHVHTIDRYRPVRDNVREALIYRALAERHGFGGLLTDAGDGSIGIRGLTAHAGAPAETFFRSSGHRFDYIVSRAVLEHLYDPLAALDDMAAGADTGRYADPPYRFPRPRHVRRPPSTHLPDHSRCALSRHDPWLGPAEPSPPARMARLARPLAAHGIVKDRAARRGGRRHGPRGVGRHRSGGAADRA